MRFRKAVRTDTPVIVSLLANDELGRKREKYEVPLSEKYYEAFDRISSDSNQELMVVEDSQSEIIGTLHLTFIPYLTYQGGIRAQIEAVRIRDDLRGQGIGQELFTWAIARARERNAHLLQLTTDKQRAEAIEFYTKLGFKASHEGMKMNL